MKTNARCSRFYVVFIFSLSFAFSTPAQTPARPTVRIKPATVPLVTADRLRPVMTTVATNQMLEVSVPQNSKLLVRRDGRFVSATNSRAEGTNKVYQLQQTDVYSSPGSNLPPVALSTKAGRLPGSVQATVNGQTIEGYVDVALQSTELVYNPTNRSYEGALDICFRSSASPELAKKLTPVDLRFQHTPGLHLSTNAVTLEAKGNQGCHVVAIQCSQLRRDETVTVKSDSLGEQVFLVEFEAAGFGERNKTVLIILGGVCLGALGGLVRTWHPPKVKQAWKRVAEGSFCGLILVLLGEFGVKQFFQWEGPVTSSILLGLCGVLGYLGVRMFEKFASPLGGKKSKR